MEEKQYVSDNAQLMDEWNWEKNTLLGYSSDVLTIGSGRKVWWRCKEGHEWQTSICNRIRKGSKCPYCTGKKVIEGVNDLSTVKPKLAAEWHPTKNGKLSPNQVMRNSKKRIWWICGKGHEWEANLDSRNSKGSGCPYCSGRRVIKGKNDLVTLRPDIAELWNTDKNETVDINTISVASGREFWWKGSCGHEWKTRVATMCDKRGLEICPICSSENRTSFPEQAIYYYLLKNFKDTTSRYRVQKKEIDVYIPSLSVGIEYDGMRYHTDDTEAKEHEKDEFFLNKGIRIFRIKEYKEDIVITKDYTIFYKPWENYIHLNQALAQLFKLISDYCHISLEHIDIDVNRDNAKILALFLKKNKDNSLRIKHPLLFAEWNFEKNGDLDPIFVREGSNQKFWWKCSKGHEWKAAVNERTSHGTGCPFCAGNMLVIGENDLETNADITLLQEWNYSKNRGLHPSGVTAKTNRKVWWKCKLGHEWEAAVGARLKGSGCPYCSGRLAIEGQTDLLTTNPDLAGEWLYEENSILPQSVKAGSNIKVWWQGKCGHKWEMKVADRSKGVGCPYCAGKKVLIGYNDLETSNPLLALEWNFEKNVGISPQDVTSGSSKNVWWRCSKGHEWKASIVSRAKGNGCPYCSRRIAWKGETDISTTNPNVALFWDFERNKDIDIFSCVAGSEKSVWWICENGHSWKNMIKRQVSNNKCPICSPNNETKILLWRKNNPNGTKTQCSKEIGISLPTIARWWR